MGEWGGVVVLVGWRSWMKWEGVKGGEWSLGLMMVDM